MVMLSSVVNEYLLDLFLHRLDVVYKLLLCCHLLLTSTSWICSFIALMSFTSYCYAVICC